MNTKIANLTKEMIEYNRGDMKRINHALKVHQYARTIGILENIDEKDLFNLESAAILHDIGIKNCIEKYNSTGGKLQEKEGPPIASKILEKLNYKDYERILYLISHHHSYNKINGIDYQILIEADFLVNLQEDNASKKTIENVYNKIFKTKSGKQLVKLLF